MRSGEDAVTLREREMYLVVEMMVVGERRGMIRWRFIGWFISRPSRRSVDQPGSFVRLSVIDFPTDHAASLIRRSVDHDGVRGPWLGLPEILSVSVGIDWIR